MLRVQSMADFERLMQEPRALLLLEFAWSVPAKLSTQVASYGHGRWHLYTKAPRPPLYVLEGDSIPELFGWVADALRETGGFGSLYWLKYGEVIERVPCVIEIGIERIVEISERLFG
jgi:hypothetical protein